MTTRPTCCGSTALTQPPLLRLLQVLLVVAVTFILASLSMLKLTMRVPTLSIQTSRSVLSVRLSARPTQVGQPPQSPPAAPPPRQPAPPPLLHQAPPALLNMRSAVELTGPVQPPVPARTPARSRVITTRNACRY